MGELLFVGLGLHLKQVTVEALEALSGVDEVFAEFYTSFLIGSSPSELEAVVGRPVKVLGRTGVEAGQAILDAAAKGRVALVTAGDPMTATTHLDLRLRAVEAGIPTRIIHGVSILSAASGAAGLHSYKFGRTTTLVFPEKNYNPSSPYEAVRENKQRGLHTLVLLDLRADEGRYMSAAEGAQILLGFEKELRGGVVVPGEAIVALARVGTPSQRIVAATAERVAEADLGPPLHCLILPGRLHFSEERALALHR